MYNLHIATDLDECQDLWQRLVPAEVMFDLWEVRECFHRHFQRPPRFIVAETAEGICGLLPASWIEESRCYGYFPGETWEGKTWLEQNRILARDESVLAALLSPCRPSWHFRYLLPLNGGPNCDVVDETGYLFLAPEYDYDMENYFREFSHKSARRLKRELDAIQARGVRYRLDDLSDFDILVRMNLERFGDRSYFSDGRFLESFRSLMNFLNERGWLRLTALIIDGEAVAVDMGCVYRDVYTLLGGGTHAGYPGIAKFINIHHMHRACRERLQQVDFLCGDFSWKRLFHLRLRPLCLLTGNTAAHAHGEGGSGRPTRGK